MSFSLTGFVDGTGREIGFDYAPPAPAPVVTKSAGSPRAFSGMISAPTVKSSVRDQLNSLGPGYWGSDHQEEARHFTSWNYIAIHAKAKQAAAAKLEVFKKGRHGAGPDAQFRGKYLTKSMPDSAEQEKLELDDRHPFRWLLDRPNPRFDGGLFRYFAQQQISLTGKALIWWIPNMLGRPAEMWVLPTALCRPQPPNPQFPEGSFWFSTIGTYSQANYSSFGLSSMVGMTIDARYVIQIGWPHAYLIGECQSPLHAGAIQFDIAEQMDLATFYAFKKGVKSDLILSIDPAYEISEPDIDRIQAKIDARHAGPTNTGSPLLLKGVTPNQIGRAPAELDYVNGRTQSRDVSLAFHQFSPQACGVSGGGGYSEFWAAVQQTTELSVQPDLDLIANGLAHHLGPYFGDDIGLSIKAKSIQDPTLMQSALSLAVSAKSITYNEMRAKQGDPPIPWGDVQVGTPIGPDGKPVNPNQQPGMPGQGGEGTPEDDGAPADDLDELFSQGDEDPDDDGTDTGTARPELKMNNRMKKHFYGRSLMVKGIDFDESKHPRADDGKFGSGGGKAKKEPSQRQMKRASEKQRATSAAEGLHPKEARQVSGILADEIEAHGGWDAFAEKFADQDRFMDVFAGSIEPHAPDLKRFENWYHNHAPTDADGEPIGSAVRAKWKQVMGTELPDPLPEDWTAGFEDAIYSEAGRREEVILRKIHANLFGEVAKGKSLMSVELNGDGGH